MTIRSVIHLARLVAALALILLAAKDGHVCAAESEQSQLVTQVNSPVSDILQLTVQNSYAATCYGPPGGQGNFLSLFAKVPIRSSEYFPFNQMTLLTVPTEISRPGDPAGFGDIRLLDLVAFVSHPDLDIGIGPTFIFPTASSSTTGQGKWQIGPSGGIVYTPGRWLFGTIIQNPISIGGDPGRPNANEMILWPFVTYNLGKGWFLRSEPQMVFDWVGNKQFIPVNLGIGRVFNLGGQWMSAYIEPGWNTVSDGNLPQYSIAFGFAVVFPRFWHEFN